MTIVIKQEKQQKYSEFSIKIKYPKSKNLWIYGEQKESLLWDVYIINPKNDLRKIIKRDITTKAFSLFVNIGLLQDFDLSKTREFYKKEKENDEIMDIQIFIGELEDKLSDGIEIDSKTFGKVGEFISLALKHNKLSDVKKLEELGEWVLSIENRPEDYPQADNTEKDN